MDGPKGGCQVVIMKYFALLKGNGIVVAKQVKKRDRKKDRQFAIAVLSDQVKSTIGIDTNSYYGRRKTQGAKIWKSSLKHSVLKSEKSH